MNIDVINRALEWAKEQGMNQSAFAARLGVLPQHITNWKSRGVPAEQYQPLADALGKSVDELLGRTRVASISGNVSEPPFQRWPVMPSIDEAKVMRLSGPDRSKLEAVILMGAAQVGLDVKKDG